MMLIQNNLCLYIGILKNLKCSLVETLAYVSDVTIKDVRLPQISNDGLSLLHSWFARLVYVRRFLT